MDGTCGACKAGYYGKSCDKMCSSNCRSTIGSPVCNYTHGSCTDGCVHGKKGNHCSEDCPEGWYGLNCSNKCGYCKGGKGCNVSSGECGLQGCQEQYTGPNCREETTILLSREDVRINNGQASQPTTTRILLEDLWKYTHDKKTGGLFMKEYRKLPSGMCESHVVALLPQNKLKNRYKDVCAFDHTRVILDIENSNSDSDYINACYISGYKTVKPAYIASQGPTPANINEFWRMIWVVEADKVVMLTNLVELGTSKCLQYWPLVDQKVEHGGISIITIQEDIFSHFTIRTLQISRNGGDETRTIKQYHYKAWSDRTVPPDVVSLIEFRDKVVKSPTKHPGPIVVHCSAGIGRTGTFIALDYLMEEGKVEDSVDVFNCVSRMRHERVNMVQTMDQYCLLHEALAEWYLMNETVIPVTSYQPVVQTLLKSNRQTGLPQLQSLFQKIKYACPKQDKSDFFAALSEENKNKNRDSTILASDKYRAYLITEVDGSNDYINAVHLPSYTRKGGFILTQTPLRNTVTDYWMLVADAGVQVIVDFDPVVTGIKDSNPYFPSISTTQRFGPLLVTCTEEDVHIETGHYTINKYNIKQATNDEFNLDVKLYKCNFWKDDTTVPVSPAPIFMVLKDIRNSYMDLYDDPILVQCINGVDKSGLFCVLAGTIERLFTEENVNIVHVIQQLRRSRPQVITCYEQFRFCYEAIAEYLYDRSGYVKSC
ncbi:receptor-type tyrosine-protein phosphatase kappa, partial [Patella vulgata]|uniref:receptor-type tyrosine-protein phosphatase kappa n=1 Tax=Patella vulgata TaxID=6465 RepID=UPI0024A9F208